MSEPAQLHAQIIQRLVQSSRGSAPDAFDFTTKPTAPELSAPDVHKGEWITDITYQSLLDPLGGHTVLLAPQRQAYLGLRITPGRRRGGLVGLHVVGRRPIRQSFRLTEEQQAGAEQQDADHLSCLRLRAPRGSRSARV